MGWMAAGHAEEEPVAPPAPPSVPRPMTGGGGPRPGGLRLAPAMAGGHGGVAVLSPPRALQPRARPARLAQARDAALGGDWPRTNRVLPWMIAVFIVMLWLVPFNSVQLAVSTPVDMHLDRLVLPVIVVVWLMAMAIGGRARRGIRLTWIHAGVAGYIAVRS